MNFTFASAETHILELQQRGVATGQHVTVLLIGAPGIGKTSAARAAALRMPCAEGATPVVRVLDLTSMLPEDLLGLPQVTAHAQLGKVTSYAAPAWLAECCHPDAVGVLVLDDLPAASLPMQVAARQIALERRVHDHPIARGIQVVVTGNRREDKSAAGTLPAHFRNSVLQMPILADMKEWERYHYGSGHDPMIAQFLAFKPDHFSRLPKDADASGVFATPRTWSMLASLLPVARRLGSLPLVAAGLVGEGVAIELEAFSRMYSDLVPAEAVLDSPETAIPDVDAFFVETAEGGQKMMRVDRMISVTSSLACCTVSRWKTAIAEGRPAEPVIAAFFRALAWIVQGRGQEYMVSAYFVLQAAYGPGYTQSSYTNSRGVAVQPASAFREVAAQLAGTDVRVRTVLHALLDGLRS